MAEVRIDGWPITVVTDPRMPKGRWFLIGDPDELARLAREWMLAETMRWLYGLCADCEGMGV